MKSIFFDLETTDLNFCGQILNYAFVAVDDNWKVTDKLHGQIKLSKTQLPGPYAILANRVDVLKHQDESVDYEPEAMAKIKDWLVSVVEQEQEKVRLIGYNSVRFDIPFLRTSMIRNGVSPYHPNLIVGDLMHVTQKLATVNPDFRATVGPALSLKLENVCKTHGLLKGKQTHESLDDVMITIELAKYLSTWYGLDVRRYQEYEPKKIEKKKDGVVIKVSPERLEAHHKEVYTNYKSSARMVLLDSDRNYSLWIDIDEWKAGKSKDAISWYAKNYSPFFINGTDDSEDARLLAIEAKDDLSHVNLGNFFPDRNCDIEQFIYMMKFDEIDALYDAIWKNDLSTLKVVGGKFSAQLYLRYLMNYGEDSEATDNLIRKYAKYRYGGKMKTNKMDITSVYQEGVKNPAFHQTLTDLVATVNDLIAKRESPEDKFLLEQLLKWYESTPIMRLI